MTTTRSDPLQKLPERTRRPWRSWRPPPLTTVDLIALAGVGVLFAWFLLTANTTPVFRLVGVAGGLALCTVIPFRVAVRRGEDLATALAVPVLLSALQNVLLLPLAAWVDAGELRLLLSLNLLATALLLGLAAWHERDRIRSPRGQWPRSVTASCLVVLLVAAYAVAAVVLSNASMTSLIAGSRNLVSIPVFLVLGVLCARLASPTRYAGALVALGWVVVAFGLVERFHSSFWYDVDLATLWQKKGLPIADFGLPLNFVSSEQIAGEQIRRMVSTFADPVNLGSFLFVAVVAACFLGRRWSALVLLLGCVLTISKGALVGLLVLALVVAWFYLSRRAVVAVLAGCVVVAAAFVAYSLTSSTGSLMAHVRGFLVAFQELPGAPLGHGIGRSGVLAQVLDESGGVTSSTAESGIGVIVGQLGLPGLVVFGLLFVALARDLTGLRDRRTAALGWTLLLSLTVNAAFNEVALSPNSCGPYFLLLGLVLGAVRVAPFAAGPAAPAEHSPVGARAIAVGAAAAVATAGLWAATGPGTQEASVTVSAESYPRSLQMTRTLDALSNQASNPIVLATAVGKAGLTSGNELEARGTVDDDGRSVVFQVAGPDPDVASQAVAAWAAEAELRATRVRYSERRPPDPTPLNLPISSPEVDDRPLGAGGIARLLALVLVTGTGVGFVVRRAGLRRKGTPGGSAPSGG